MLSFKTKRKKIKNYKLDKDYFYFKNFKLRNRDTALKINTDGVLLAVWADIAHADTILDVGTGGGVIPFILNQRYPNPRIDGIDIHKLSIEEARFNKSINGVKQLYFYHTSLQDFVEGKERSYDHVISNPPFFIVPKSKTSAYKENLLYKKELSGAKHTLTLDHETLIKGTSNLLKTNGKCSFILPYDLMDNYLRVSTELGLLLTTRCKISGKKGANFNRVMLEFIKKDRALNINISEDSIFIRNDDNSYSTMYKEMTKDFYLNF